MTLDARTRRYIANERIKLIANGFNIVAAGSFVSVGLVTFVNLGSVRTDWDQGFAIAVLSASLIFSLTFHGCAHWFLGKLTPEDR